MKTNGGKIWFPAKKCGWGWGAPCAWQGWVVLVVFVILLCVTSALLLRSGHFGLYITSAAVLCISVIAICLIKGERPRWRWEDSESSQARSTADRLAELHELRRRQLVSEAEYKAKREEILRGLQACGRIMCYASERHASENETYIVDKRWMAGGELRVCLLLTGFAFFYVLPTEHRTCSLLGCRRPSPFWFRAGCSAVFCLPSVFWLWSAWRRCHSRHEHVA